jgi:L-idonate 5-dehydrogenase
MPHLDGGFQQYVAVPASCCHRLPDSVDYATGALLEPLAVAAHAVERSGGVAGKRVLITGVGAIGQCVLTVARATGASRIAVSDPDPFARSFALRHGAEYAVDPSQPDAEALLAECADGGFDIALEASGSPRAMALAIQACARGATIVQIGNLPADGAVVSNLLMSKELALLGSFRYVNVFEKVLDMIASGRLAVGHLVTHVLPLENLPAAIEAAACKGSVIKVQVIWRDAVQGKEPS